MTDQSTPAAVLEYAHDGEMLRCLGDWTLLGVTVIEPHIKSLLKKANEVTVIDGQAIARMDSAGALLLIDIVEKIQDLGQQVVLSGFSKQYRSLMNIVEEEADSVHHPPKPPKYNWFYRLGEASVDRYFQAMSFLAFIGELSIVILRLIANPLHIQWRSTMKAIDETGYQALPILALMSFLIGVVLAYQLGNELRIYGATIFVVDVSGMAILREFGPLITAIILAGRTSTSFAALIGTMKVNEEIDALRSMGLSPVERLVVPRIFGLVIAFPLLVVWSDIFGLMGSMVMAKGMLGIGYIAFMHRLEEAMQLKHYILGLIKSPVFALIIAGVGCFQGFQVGSSAESVGWQTTKAAVQAIFLIIVADSLFSVIYSWLNL